MEWFKDKNRRTGVIVTVAAHLLLLLIMSFIILEPPFPPPPQLGVEVNLGSSDQGMGNIQPDNPAEQASRTNPNNSPEKLATQNTEQTIKMDNNPNVTTNQKTTDDVEETKDPVIDKTFTFKKNNNPGGSEGNTNQTGDQGKKDGDPNASNYVGDGGKGGVSFELKGRGEKELDRPKNIKNIEGKVVVKIWVNKRGEVVEARQEVSRSTTTNPTAVQRAISSAKKSMFNSDPDAQEIQTGYITYIFTF